MGKFRVDDPELHLLYCEISSLVARCAFDYWRPFSLYTDPAQVRSVILLEDLIKFRPSEPVVYTGMVDVLVGLNPSVQVAVIQFYEALERWRREVDTLAIVGRNTFDASYLVRLQRRLGEVFPYAILVMQELRPLVNASIEIDRLSFTRLFELAADERRLHTFDDPIREVVSLSNKAREAKLRYFRCGGFSTQVKGS